MFVGVDGHARGWVAVVIDANSCVGAASFPTFAALLHAYDGAELIGVDIPIGLTDDGARAADRAARAFLQGQASSVFNAPARAVLQAESYAQANALSIRAAGKGLSRQSFALMPKIREVAACASDRRVYEVHPEVAFRILGDGRLAHGKKTWGGLRQRLQLLARDGIVLPATLGSADAVGIDDVVDAAAAAWSARRIARGVARRFPAGRARAPAIWA